MGVFAEEYTPEGPHEMFLASWHFFRLHFNILFSMLTDWLTDWLSAVKWLWLWPSSRHPQECSSFSPRVTIAAASSRQNLKYAPMYSSFFCRSIVRIFHGENNVGHNYCRLYCVRDYMPSTTISRSNTCKLNRIFNRKMSLGGEALIMTTHPPLENLYRGFIMCELFAVLSTQYTNIYVILILGVCVLLRMWDQGDGGCCSHHLDIYVNIAACSIVARQRPRSKYAYYSRC
jgi:hypothetical protein